MASGLAASRTTRIRASAALFRRPWLRAGLLLSAPLGWFVLIYLAALVLLFISALWTVDSFTGNVIHHWTLNNFKTLFTVSAYRTIALRTLGIAAAVTVTDALLALPFAFFAARIAPPRLRAALFVAVLIPRWSSYRVRVYVCPSGRRSIGCPTPTSRPPPTSARAAGGHGAACSSR